MCNTRQNQLSGRATFLSITVALLCLMASTVKAYSQNGFRRSANSLMARSSIRRQPQNVPFRAGAHLFRIRNLKGPAYSRQQSTFLQDNRWFSSTAVHLSDVEEIPYTGTDEWYDDFYEEDDFETFLEGFHVDSLIKTPDSEFDTELIIELVGDDCNRLSLTAKNISVPVALMLLDSKEFPSRSRARKACRNAAIMIHRGPLKIDETTGEEVFDPSKCQRAFVGDRVYPGDVLAKHTSYMGKETYPPVIDHKKPAVDMSVAFGEDDGCAPDMFLQQDEIENPLEEMTPGSNPGFYIVSQMKTPDTEFDVERIKELIGDGDYNRLNLTAHNISVPVALMLLDSVEYPSRSRARKACRKANIMIHRGPLKIDETTGEEVFDPSKCERALVGDRVYPGDVIAKQTRMGTGKYPVLNHKKPPFDLPVVYEDDYFAIVDKPAGIVVYAHKQGGHGVMTVRAGLPFVLKPPKEGIFSTLRRPQPVHRLDKPTSGLLLIAKTKPAMVHLSLQFRDRKVRKTYTALVNGIPDEPEATAISSAEAFSMNVDVDPEDGYQWQLIDEPLDEKSAVTVWRSIRYVKSLKANQNYCTLVELKPKTGRYHQLRRHMALVAERPLVGDKTYDGGGDAMYLRERGLFLCSNSVVLEHPYYNSEIGRTEFANLSDAAKLEMKGVEQAPDGTVVVRASIPLPQKFASFMKREQYRYEQLQDQDP
ncbi:unnamed protein product [Cylindrotheca closterium]|uniref:Pseudouridine synthase RsuA/RluA-like domain-containing protein n=1 Tax=Cylindrotheca closterium TaxID=2856 RepID=A0AAD2G310_9STRA|nr:unnamed protein product [Cylindrotheca closterium]